MANPYFVKGDGGRYLSNALTVLRREKRSETKGKERLSGFSLRYPKSRKAKKPSSTTDENKTGSDATSQIVSGDESSS